MASRQGVATGGGPGWCRGREPVSAARAAVTAPCPLEAASPWPRCRPPRFPAGRRLLPPSPHAAEKERWRPIACGQWRPRKTARGPSCGRVTPLCG